MCNKKTILTINNLNLALKDNALSSQRLLLSNINLKVNKKEVVAIIGASGSGKSLTALSLVNLLPENISHSKGSIVFNGKEITNLSSKELQQIRGKDIGFIFQNPALALNPLKKVGKQLIEPFIIHNAGASKQEIKAKVKEALNLVGLKNFYSRLNNYPHQFSGGQLQRLMIAMAIINKPKFLIADEPTTALDKINGTKVINLLSNLAKQLNLSVLIISHDLKTVKNIANTVYVVDQGKVIEKGSVEDIFNNPKHSVTKLLMGKIDYLEPTPYNSNAKDILQVSGLNSSYLVKSNLILKNKYKDFLKNINFTIKEQDSIGLIGRSGAGKSSIINAILQMHSYSGKVLLCNQDVSKKEHKSFLRKNMQLVFQNTSSSLNPRALVKDIVLEGLNIYKNDLSFKEKMNIILNLFDKMNLAQSLLLRYSTELSGGQKQRVAIIRALAIKPKILILDEPTSALDKFSEMKVMQTFREMQVKHNMAFIFISHNIDIVKSFCNKILVVEDGKVIEKGLLKDILANPKHETTNLLLN